MNGIYVTGTPRLCEILKQFCREMDKAAANRERGIKTPYPDYPEECWDMT